MNPEEQAAVAAFQAALVRFGSIELVQGPVDARDALSQLAAVLASEPTGGDYPVAPVQVLEMSETWGLEFDALWLTGFDDETWPPPVDPNPFIPMEWHRKYKLPAGTPEVELERAQRVTQRLLISADRVIVSHAMRDGDRSLGASPLVRGIERLELQRLDLAALEGEESLLRGSAQLESLVDERAPPLRLDEQVRGGTRVLKLQATCPFRAYGELRLGATALQAEQPFLDARLRGTLLHASLERLWRRLRSSQALQALDAGAMESILARATEEAIESIELAHGRVLKPRRRSVEVARLARTMRDWLEVERARASFEIHALEAERTVTLAAMGLRTRADRIDRLADGALVIIDYKSGGAERRAPACWLGVRPDEPQVPLYALAEQQPLAGVFIGHVRPGSSEFSGAASGPGIVPDVAGDADGQQLVRLRVLWRESLERLAAAFAGGDARVDPKHGNQTCRRCELGPLCRIAEATAEVPDG
jgi:probable DNA repair protein